MLLDSYEKINKYLMKGVDHTDRPAPGNKNNTRIKYVDSGIVGIELYNKIIMYYYQSGMISLYAYNWRTHVTRQRMNTWQNKFRVINDNLTWFVDYPNDGNRYIFEDGITLLPNGEVRRSIDGEMLTPIDINSDNYRRLITYNAFQINKLNNSIDRYCKRYIELFLHKHIPAPSNNDCNHCQCATIGNGHKEHMLQHIHEYEYVPSILMQAMENAKRVGFKINPNTYDTITYLWQLNGYESINKLENQVNVKKQLNQILKKYISEYLNVMTIS